MFLASHAILALGAIALPIARSNPLATEKLIISAYIEGSSNNKYLRFSALTEIPANGLADYQVEIYFNGNTSPVTTIRLNENAEALQECDSFVLADKDAVLGPSDQDSTLNFFNGDDSIVLKRISTGQLVDTIGQVGFDPGSEYSNSGAGTQDESLCRKASVAEGDANAADAFDPSVEWISYPRDIFSRRLILRIVSVLVLHLLPPRLNPWTISSMIFKDPGSIVPWLMSWFVWKPLSWVTFRTMMPMKTEI